MQICIEYLYHYRCDACQQWWSVGDIQPIPGKTIYCLHCGTPDIVPDVIENGDGEILSYDSEKCLYREKKLKGDRKVKK